MLHAEQRPCSIGAKTLPAPRDRASSRFNRGSDLGCVRNSRSQSASTLRVSAPMVELALEIDSVLSEVDKAIYLDVLYGRLGQHSLYPARVWSASAS